MQWTPSVKQVEDRRELQGCRELQGSSVNRREHTAITSRDRKGVDFGCDHVT